MTMRRPRIVGRHEKERGGGAKNTGSRIQKSVAAAGVGGGSRSSDGGGCGGGERRRPWAKTRGLTVRRSGSLRALVPFGRAREVFLTRIYGNL
ncbi:hypothetical protein NL676_028998 [Syzygium grande]|nr:hypothetical protein NL676_028998 [Syzygium grande]